MNHFAEANHVASAVAPALGNQFIVDLYDCGCERFDDLEWVEGVMVEAAQRAQATIVDVVFHKFSPIGISGIVVISESHLAIHTWPEYRYAAIDVFTCGEILDCEAAIAHLGAAFGARQRSVVKVARGAMEIIKRRTPSNPYLAPTSAG